MKHAKTSRVLSLLALVLAVAMMLTLVGCGDSGKTDDSSKTSSTTTTTTTAAGGETDGTTTDGNVEGDDTTTGVEGDTTTGNVEGDATTTAKPTTGGFFEDGKNTTTKKPTTTTTTSKKIDTSETSIFAKVPAKLKGQKIKMMIWWNTATDDTKEAKFFEEQTGIKVSFETSTMDKYQTNLSGKIMAGNPPQIAAIINEWYPQPITRGLMQPIKNTGWDYSNKKDDIYALSMMEQFSYKGEMYGVALKGSNHSTFEVMFFNKDMMKNKGIKEDPYKLWKKGQWNWETCLDIAKKCTDAKKGEYGLTNVSQFFWMLSAGQDFVLSDKNGLKNNIKSGKLLEAWNHAWDMIYTHKVIPTDFSTQPQLFFNQKVAMFGAGSFYMQAEASHSNYVPQNCKFDWGVVPYPSPKGMSPVAAVEGTTWGFPVKVTGDKLQAAMWWLRYHLDDSKYSERDFYPKEECWELMSWVWTQKVQSYNSVGVVTYGGKYTAWSIQYSVIDEATTKAAVKTNLDSWYAEIDANIDTILNEL